MKRIFFVFVGRNRVGKIGDWMSAAEGDYKINPWKSHIVQFFVSCAKHFLLLCRCATVAIIAGSHSPPWQNADYTDYREEYGKKNLLQTLKSYKRFKFQLLPIALRRCGHPVIKSLNSPTPPPYSYTLPAHLHRPGSSRSFYSILLFAQL